MLPNVCARARLTSSGRGKTPQDFGYARAACVSEPGVFDMAQRLLPHAAAPSVLSRMARRLLPHASVKRVLRGNKLGVFPSASNLPLP